MAKRGKRRGKHRGGRPRKSIEEAMRKPSGKTRDRSDPGPTIEALAQRAQVIESGDPSVLCSAAAGSYLGRLFLKGSITDLQRKAGERWWRIVTRFAQLLLAPGDPRAVDLNRPKGQVHGDDIEHFIRTAFEYDEGFSQLHDLGRDVLQAVNAALHDCETDLVLLRVGLEALHLHGAAMTRAGNDAVKHYQEWDEVPHRHKRLTRSGL